MNNVESISLSSTVSENQNMYYTEGNFKNKSESTFSELIILRVTESDNMYQIYQVSDKKIAIIKNLI